MSQIQASLATVINTLQQKTNGPNTRSAKPSGFQMSSNTGNFGKGDEVQLKTVQQVITTLVKQLSGNKDSQSQSQPDVSGNKSSAAGAKASGGSNPANKTISGTPNNDFLFHAGDDEEIVGGKGDDILIGLGNDNELKGGGGSDVIISIGNDNELKGGSGPDLLISFGNDNEIKGGSGNDVILFGGKNNDVKGGSGDDVITSLGPNGNAIDGGSDFDTVEYPVPNNYTISPPLGANGQADPNVTYTVTGPGGTDTIKNVEKIIIT